MKLKKNIWITAGILFILTSDTYSQGGKTNNISTVSQDTINIEKVFETIKTFQLPEEATKEWKKYEGKNFLVKGKLEKVVQHKAGGVVLLISVGKEQNEKRYLLVAGIVDEDTKQKALKLSSGTAISIIGYLEQHPPQSQFFTNHKITPYPYGDVDVFLTRSIILDETNNQR